MQTKIAFAGGAVGLGTLYHENMHQWWGDNVAESDFTMTFFKEGMAELARVLARRAHRRRTPPAVQGTAAGEAAFEASLVAQLQHELQPAPATSGTPPRRTRRRWRCSAAARPTAPGHRLHRAAADPRHDPFTVLQPDPAGLPRRLDHRGAARGRVPAGLPNQSPACPASSTRSSRSGSTRLHDRRRPATSRRSPGPGLGRRRLLRRQRRLFRVAGLLVRERRAPLERQRTRSGR